MHNGMLVMGAMYKTNETNKIAFKTYVVGKP